MDNRDLSLLNSGMWQLMGNDLPAGSRAPRLSIHDKPMGDVIAGTLCDADSPHVEQFLTWLQLARYVSAFNHQSHSQKSLESLREEQLSSQRAAVNQVNLVGRDLAVSFYYLHGWHLTKYAHRKQFDDWISMSLDKAVMFSDISLAISQMDFATFPYAATGIIGRALSAIDMCAGAGGTLAPSEQNNIAISVLLVSGLISEHMNGGSEITELGKKQMPEIIGLRI